MAAIDYPSALPPPDLDSYQLNHTPPFRRTEMASGRARQRRMFTATTTRHSVQWKFTSAELADFEVWFRHQINDGADWFNGWAKGSAPVDLVEQRFTGMYRITARGPITWTVQAELELRRRPTPPEGWTLITPTYLINASIFDLAINREWPAA